MDIPERPDPSVSNLCRNIAVAMFGHDHDLSLPSLIKSLVQLYNVSRKQRPIEDYGKTKRKRKATEMIQKMLMSKKMKSNPQLDSSLPAYG